MNGMIRVLWNCEMGENCINKERQGVHEEHKEMEKCRGVRKDALQPQAIGITAKPPARRSAVARLEV